MNTKYDAGSLVFMGTLAVFALVATVMLATFGLGFGTLLLYIVFGVSGGVCAMLAEYYVNKNLQKRLESNVQETTLKKIGFQ
jgi:hypothetical protein